METEAEFKTKVDHIFIMLLSAIMENDLKDVKHYLSDEVEEKFQKLIDNYLRDNVTRIFDEMNVKSTDILREYDNENGHNIEVLLTSRYMDYFLDENGEYLSGDNTRRIETIHTIVFTKKNETKDLHEVRRCPACSHSLDINVSGYCPYCGQTIDMSKYDYIITKIDLI